MVTEVIWVVVFAVPPAGGLRNIFEVRDRLRADVMYDTRRKQALAMQVWDRIVVHFGGPKGSDPWAQHLIRAGCVKQGARNLSPQDEKGTLGELFSLTRQMFPFGEITGVMFYEWFAPPPEVGPLPRPYQAPKPGKNFIELSPSHPAYADREAYREAYRKVDEWWRRVVPRGHCGRP